MKAATGGMTAMPVRPADWVCTYVVRTSLRSRTIWLTLVYTQAELDLVDSGEALQNNPIWPLLHRVVDVIIVNDNSADTSQNWPNGVRIDSVLLACTDGMDLVDQSRRIFFEYCESTGRAADGRYWFTDFVELVAGRPRT
jgi:Lysophospholipase catalytic domain